MSKQIETVKFDTLSIDTSIADRIGNEYSVLIDKLNEAQSKLNEFEMSHDMYELRGSMLALEALNKFNKRVSDNASNQQVDLYGKALSKYMYDTYGESFVSAFLDTWKSLVNSNSSDMFAKRYKLIELFDNKVTYLICNSKGSVNELRNCICKDVLKGFKIPDDWDDKDKGKLNRYISVKLKEYYARYTDDYILPKLDNVSLDKLISDVNFTSSTGSTKLYGSIVCKSIEFELDNKHVVLNIGKKGAVRGRSTILRIPVIEVMNYISANNLGDLTKMVDSNIIPFTCDKDEAQRMSKGDKYSCSIVEQTIGNSTVYFLPKTNGAKSSCTIIDKLLKSIGASDIVLNFEEL